uniref:Uncharacterized protein n=1 Tax=Mycena chlorophos TaxID=658473 RepID=A0ABQ0LCZ9_MYCCL|nr:predicted protein [Mycena chlorophos]
MPTSPFRNLMPAPSGTSDVAPTATASNFYISALLLLHLIPNNTIRFVATVLVIFLATVFQFLYPSIDTALARLDARLSEIETLVQTSKASFVGDRLTELTEGERDLVQYAASSIRLPFVSITG